MSMGRVMKQYEKNQETVRIQVFFQAIVGASKVTLRDFGTIFPTQ